jgi:hypothetical protein
MTASLDPVNTPASCQRNASFLALLPKIRTCAFLYFRHIPCPDTKADKVAETIALAWKWFLRLEEQGKDVARFPSVFVGYLTRAVGCGRRVCGLERGRDVLNPIAQRRNGFKVESLPTSLRNSLENLYAHAQGQTLQDAFEERLRDNTQSPVPDQAAFRVDWPTYFNSLTDRDRRLAEFLALGHTAKQAAYAFGISAARVTQLRQRWCREWRRCQEAEPARPGL